MAQEHKIKLLSCPICGKMPRVIRDSGYESMSFGAWCTIQCKPLFGKPHLKVEVGKASWERAYMELCQMGLMLYDMPNKDSVLSAYLRKHAFKRYVISNQCADCYSVKDFCIDHPVGTYVLLTSNHAIAVIDGNYYDTSDSGNEIPMMYWKKER
jgi:hypothetical protein